MPTENKTDIVAVQVFETVDAKIANDIQKFDVNVSAIEKVKLEIEPLTIAGPADKAGAEAVRKGGLVLKKMRTSIEAKRKELKSDVLKYGRGLDDHAKMLTALIEPLEDLTNGKYGAWERENAAIEAQKEKEAEDMLVRRVKQIIDTGAAFDGVNYSLGQEEISYSELKLMSDDAYALLYKNFFDLYEHFEKLRIEAEQAERDAAEKLLREQEEASRIAQEQEAERIRQQQFEQQKLDEQRQAQADEAARLEHEKQMLMFERQQLEDAKAAALKQRTEAREKQLKELGMTLDFGAGIWFYKTAEFGNSQTSSFSLFDLTDEGWKIVYNRLSVEIPELKEKQANLEAKQAAEAERLTAERLEQERQEAEQQSAIAEQERQAQLTDKERMGEWLQSVANVMPDDPVFISTFFTEKFAEFHSKMYDAFRTLYKISK